MKIAPTIAIVWVSSAGLLLPAPGRSQTDPCRDPDRYLLECPQVDIPRLQPSFSEDNRRGFDERGFENTFLQDALNGIGDPLRGGTIGGGQFDGSEFAPISPFDRGLLEPFDPTDVIIPLPGVRK